jgi:RNA polymerase sigma factor (sigma-70 family)
MPPTETLSNGNARANLASGGERQALAETLYAEMRRIAQALFSGEAPGHTLSRTALIHEAWMRLAKQPMPSAPTDFLRLAAHVMRNVLVDHARSRNAIKRGGDVHVTSLDHTVRHYANACATGLYMADGDTAAALRVAHELDLETLDLAIAALEEQSPRQAQVVELKFFGGLGIEEIAAQLDISASTVKREWAVARLFLLRELSEAQRRDGEMQN